MSESNIKDENGYKAFVQALVETLFQALELGYGEGIDGMIKPCFDGYDGSPLFGLSEFKLPY